MQSILYLHSVTKYNCLQRYNIGSAKFVWMVPMFKRASTNDSHSLTFRDVTNFLVWNVTQLIELKTSKFNSPIGILIINAENLFQFTLN